MLRNRALIEVGTAQGPRKDDLVSEVNLWGQPRGTIRVIREGRPLVVLSEVPGLLVGDRIVKELAGGGFKVLRDEKLVDVGRQDTSVELYKRMEALRAAVVSLQRNETAQNPDAAPRFFRAAEFRLKAFRFELLDSCELNSAEKLHVLNDGLWPLSDEEKYFIENKDKRRPLASIDHQWLLVSLDRIARDLSRASDQIVDPASFANRVEELDRYYHLVFAPDSPLKQDQEAEVVRQPGANAPEIQKQIILLQSGALADQIKTLRNRAEDYLRRAGSDDARVGVAGTWGDRP
ncbi:MAG TPA: hypothetical protein VFT74_19765, partial [Isosphaeraceae bacterium]|nr:hypothetical protein [Isosphaeraceae bacterium]